LAAQQVADPPNGEIQFDEICRRRTKCKPLTILNRGREETGDPRVKIA
jgi:hypothetical protein